MRLSIFVLLAATVLPPTDPCISESSSKQVRLAHELETMALTTNAAALIRAGRPEKALLLLEQRLTSAVSQASDLTNESVTLPGGTPNLRAAASRAAKYATENGLTNVATRAQGIAKKLE